MITADSQPLRGAAAEREARIQTLLTPRRQSFYRRHEAGIITLAALVVGLSAWEAFVRAGFVRPTLLAGPTQVIGALAKMATTGLLWRDLSASGLNFILGFTLAACVGIPLGLLLGTQWRLEVAFKPYVMGFNSVPRLAFISLLIVWFGLGIQAKVVLIFLSAVFPIVINTWDGVRVVDPVLLRAGRAYGATGWRLFWRVIIPYALPFIVSGLRLGVSHGLIGVFASEIFGTDVGIGYRIIVSGTNFMVPELFASVLVLATIGVLTTQLLDRAERRIAPWRAAQRR
jgi:ABC-type nitrate/sulfonate/bicarbonate transport system permease component